MTFNIKNIFRIAPLLVVLILGISLSPQAQIVVAQPLNFDGGISSMLSGFYINDDSKGITKQIQTIEPKSSIPETNTSEYTNCDNSTYVIVDNEIYKVCPNDKNMLIKVYPKEAVQKKITICPGNSKKKEHQ